MDDYQRIRRYLVEKNGDIYIVGIDRIAQHLGKSRSKIIRDLADEKKIDQNIPGHDQPTYGIVSGVHLARLLPQNPKLRSGDNNIYYIPENQQVVLIPASACEYLEVENAEIIAVIVERKDSSKPIRVSAAP